jgi:hypothetical protein
MDNNTTKGESKSMKDFRVIITGMTGLHPDYVMTSSSLKAEDGVQSLQSASELIKDNGISVPLFTIVASSKEIFLKIISDNASSLWDCMVEQDNQA